MSGEARTNPMKRLTALLMLGCVLCMSVAAQLPDAPLVPANETDERMATSGVPSATRELTAADVETFLEGIIPLQLAREDIAGATVAIVKDGQLLFAKGYGYADVKNKKPVSPEETLFRPGSVSKLFTWTAVMQLVEQGKLDLDRDVNEYLDFKIPEAFGQPITLKHILTHTAGFEEQLKDFFAADKRDPNLGEYVRTHLPQRIFPAGTTPAYSNYATTLAGYIVERASGQAFNDYVKQHIFDPLGMTRSTFAQPLPPELAPLMSNGYKLASDEPEPFETISLFPAGSMSSPALDMAKFMLAHLQGGQLNGRQILRPETTRMMRSRQFALDPRANAMALGFYEEPRNDRRIIGHAGDTILFHSDLHLMPDEGVGFFVSYNSAGKGQISGRTILWEALMDRYFPAPPSEQPALDTAKADAASVSGTYMISRRLESSAFKLFAVIGEATVAAREDGTIEVSSLTETNGKPKRWREIAPLTFRDVNGQDSLIFKPDADGRMQMVLPYPFMVFQRVGFWQNSRVLLPVIGISLAVMLLTLVLTPVAWLVRRHYKQKLDLTRTEKRLRYGVLLVFALDLIFIAAMLGLVMYGLTNIHFLTGGSNIWFFLAQAVGVVGALGTLVIIFNAVYAWSNRRNRIWGKLGATVLAFASLGFLWFVLAGNLLSFSSNY